jgi:hypothetical protein
MMSAHKVGADCMTSESDILERLRTGHPSRQTIKDVGHLLEEAADEIEHWRREVSRTDLALLEAEGKLSALRESLRKELQGLVAGERAAILELIELQRVDGHLYDADYALRTLAAAIKAREQQYPGNSLANY